MSLRLQDVSRYDARICDACMEFTPRRLATPLQLSSGEITEVTEALATVIVEAGADGRRAEGRGAIYLSDLWAWPESTLAHSLRDEVLRRVCVSIARELPSLTAETLLHPTETGLRLHHWACNDLQAPENPPALAYGMCASPFDAAIHDAVGCALECSAFHMYDTTVALPSADEFFPSGGACAAIAAVLGKPRLDFPAWLVVNESDSDDDVFRAIDCNGYYCFKLKIVGANPETDAQRTSEVYRAVRSRLSNTPRLTVDSNEGSADADSVGEFLDRLMEIDADAYAALEYLEQPTHRDIERAAFDWRGISSRKPVLLDEGLDDLTVLPMAISQGWSGLALKTCKGHSLLLAAAAWAHQHGMLLSLQDLTNPGISLIHASLVASHLPTINGVELNSPQFTPDANKDFLPRLSDLFEPHRGRHRLPAATPVGLGSRL